jgi:hypothetical protein
MKLLILLILFIIISFIGVIYYYNKKNIESFSDIIGTIPVISGSRSFWSKGPYELNSFQEINKINTNCSPRTLCNDKNMQFGIYNDDCQCISPNKKIVEEEEQQEEEREENNLESPLMNIYIPKIKIFDKDCYPNNTNFDQLCKIQYDSNYGVKKIIPCDEDNSKVECGFNYINNIYYGDNTLTPCLNKSDDFDVWCRYYNNISTMPLGYNLNSIGAKKILVGSEGGCYTNNGKSDNNNARALCDYKHIDEKTRLNPINNNIDYNIYTECLPLDYDNFNASCKDLMNINSVIPTQIMGYDCNPGYGRAKCLKSDDKFEFDKNFFNKKKHVDLNISCAEKCSKKIIK